jgi:hypothetical protein
MRLSPRSFHKQLNLKEDLTTHCRGTDEVRMPLRRLPVYEPLLEKRGRVWRWSVCTTEGQVIMQGAEGRRASARYQANRALFLMLLCAPYPYSYRRNGYRRSSSQSGRSRTSS